MFQKAFYQRHPPLSEKTSLVLLEKTVDAIPVEVGTLHAEIGVPFHSPKKRGPITFLPEPFQKFFGELPERQEWRCVEGFSKDASFRIHSAVNTCVRAACTLTSGLFSGAYRKEMNLCHVNFSLPFTASCDTVCTQAFY